MTVPPLVTVVVPVYNVEEYLTACLESIEHQTHENLEVIMVNDGSTDGSVAIAEEFARRDPRFKLITQENGGLSRARNTGADAATGEYLGFVDSDDVIPHNAYELLVTPLEETGSDFATGNVNRLTTAGLVPARFLARAFDRTRLKTHVTKFRPLLFDRIVPNKLWRRSFWQDGGYRFPEGVLHEDIPVVLPAHFAARSVDVIQEPVYYYRVREGSDLSITQRRLEPRALIGRIDAVEHVQAYLAKEGPRRARRWYEQSVMAEDLRYYLDVLDGASDEYRELFLERVNEFIDRADDERGLYRDLRAIDRLKWHLVRRRLMPELLQVIRFQKEHLRETPPVRVGRRWYGDYPFRTDAELKIPRPVYLLHEELVVSPRVDDLRFDGDELKIGGYAFIAGLGAPTPESQRVTVTVVRRGRLLRVRMRTSAIRLRARVLHRPEVTASTTQASADAQWSGFEATLPPRKLRTLGRWRPGTWDLYVTVRAGGVTRRRSRFLVDSPRPVRAVDRALPSGLSLKAAPAHTGEIALHLRDGWASIVGHRLVDAEIELSGRMHGAGSALRFARPGAGRLELPLERSADEFTVRVSLEQLSSAVEEANPEPAGSEYAGAKLWNLWTVGKGEPSRRVSLEEHVREGSWPCGSLELALVRTKDGDAVLLARAPQPVVEEARWSESGELELSGALGAGAPPFDELVLAGRLHLVQHLFPLEVDGSGRFRATLTPGRVRSLAGELPLREGNWELFARPAGAKERAQMTPVLMTQQLFEELPMRHVINHKTFLLTVTPQLQVVVAAHRDLDDDGERGRFHQRQLREHVYAPGREQELLDAVVFMTFGGRQYADSPRALHEELARQASSLERLWVVRDGRAVIPPSGRALRAGSREYYEAMARARVVVVNGFLPEWFRRRPDQVIVQTLQGTPLKRVGLDVPHLRSTMRRSWQWSNQMENWQYVLSGSSFASPILRQAFGFDGEILELGLPRNDVLAAPDRETRAAEVRRALGIPSGARVVLYAPTYRDHVVDRRGRYRMDQHLDVARVLEALGPDTFLLLRKHPSVADVPETGGFERVIDVSLWQAASELLAASDVLVTDYSALAVDFANTGRPMIFFAYDLDTYRDDIRGFYIDYEAEVPGPIVRTTEELAEALRAVDGVPPEYAERYRAWRDRFCPLDDGRAAARLIERLF